MISFWRYSITIFCIGKNIEIINITNGIDIDFILRVVVATVSVAKCGAREHGWLFEPGKSLSKDIRLLIIGNIIKNGGNPETGVFLGKFIDIARPLGVSSAVV